MRGFVALCYFLEISGWTVTGILADYHNSAGKRNLSRMSRGGVFQAVVGRQTKNARFASRWRAMCRDSVDDRVGGHIRVRRTTKNAPADALQAAVEFLIKSGGYGGLRRG